MRASPLQMSYHRLDHGEKGSLEDLSSILYKKKLLPKCQSIIQNGEVNLESFQNLSRKEVVHILYKSLFPSLFDRWGHCGRNLVVDIDELEILAKFLNESRYVSQDDSNEEYLGQLKKVAVEAVKQGKVHLLTLCLTYRAASFLYSLGSEKDQISLLHLAAAYGQKQSVQLMLQKGMNVNVECRVLCNPLDLALGYWDLLIDPKLKLDDQTRREVAKVLRDAGGTAEFETTPNMRFNDRLTSKGSQKLLISYFAGNA